MNLSARACSLLGAWLFVSSAASLRAQVSAAPEPPPTVLRTGTRLVVVDVSVRDTNGNPVHGLPREAFHLDEDKAPQRVRNFEEHAQGEPARPGPPVPQLPPSSFTNYTPVPPSGTLNVLLVDALNTPTTDQTYLRDQLNNFVRHAPPGQSIAIFGLNSCLYLLQGFTQDAAVLREAIAHRLKHSGSSLLDDPNGTRTDPTKASDAFADLGPGTDDAVASLQQFESDNQAMQLQFRAQFTLDALNALGHYLQNFNGRKNLIWFSGSFPLNILPDPSVNNAFRGMQINARELRNVTDLLSRAQVAIYPVDPRGLQAPPMFDAANSGRRYANAPQNVGKYLAAFNASQAAEHTTMEQMAADTGGHAFYNTNDLAGAVNNALRDGSDYYTLTYSPTNRTQDGEFRRIHVELASAPGLQLAYRRGYYAVDAAAAPQIIPGAADPAARTAEAYSRAAMSFGSPAPEDVLFQAHVVPAPGAPQPAPAAGNQLATGPAAPKGPFRTYSVDFAALPDAFTFATSAAGRRVASIAFKVFVFDRDGQLLNSAGKVLRLNLADPEYRRIMNTGVGLHMDVSAPADRESFLRIGIQDVPSNRYGVVELSTRQIAAAQLQPASPGASPR